MLRENGDLVVLGEKDFCAFRFISNILDLEKLNGNKVWRSRRLKSFQKKEYLNEVLDGWRRYASKKEEKIEIWAITTATTTTTTTATEPTNTTKTATITATRDATPRATITITETDTTSTETKTTTNTTPM